MSHRETTLRKKSASGVQPTVRPCQNLDYGPQVRTAIPPQGLTRQGTIGLDSARFTGLARELNHHPRFYEKLADIESTRGLRSLGVPEPPNVAFVGGRRMKYRLRSLRGLKPLRAGRAISPSLTFRRVGPVKTEQASLRVAGDA